jgi:hypothetical protein
MMLSATISAWANAARAILGEFVAATSPRANTLEYRGSIIWSVGWTRIRPDLRSIEDGDRVLKGSEFGVRPRHGIYKLERHEEGEPGDQRLKLGLLTMKWIVATIP